MLVLTRKTSEQIRIGDDIVIKVIRTSRGSVKLGIDAPSDVRVMRMELEERAAAEESQASRLMTAESTTPGGQIMMAIANRVAAS